MRLEPSPTRALAGVSLRQLSREHGFLLLLVLWLASSLFLAIVNFLTTGFATPWCLWPIAVSTVLLLAHGYLSVVRGRRGYLAQHRRLAVEHQGEAAGRGSERRSADLRDRVLSLLASARQALRASAPEVLPDLSRGETLALTTLAWLDDAGDMLDERTATAARRHEVADLLSRPGLGALRGDLETLRAAIDGHEVALGTLERETERRQSILESFMLALEGAVAAKDREDLLAAVTGPLRDRVRRLESVPAAEPEESPDPAAAGVASAERIQEEVRLARQLQLSILPDKAPRVPGLSVSHLCCPSSEVGGDFYDFYALDSDRLLIALGDASGHGLDSSMVSSMAKSALYTQVSAGRSLPDTMAEMNRLMSDTLGRQRLMTLALLEVDTRNRLLRWVNAGQVYPLLRSVDGVRELEAPSYPLGVRRATSYEVFTERLAPGDVLLVFTDGYVEALNGEGQPFGWERLGATLEELGDADTETLVEKLTNALQQHTGDTQLEDDVTLIAIRLEAS